MGLVEVVVTVGGGVCGCLLVVALVVVVVVVVVGGGGVGVCVVGVIGGSGIDVGGGGGESMAYLKSRSHDFDKRRIKRIEVDLEHLKVRPQVNIVHR